MYVCKYIYTYHIYIHTHVFMCVDYVRPRAEAALG